MYSVLLQEEPVLVMPEETFLVDVTVLISDMREVSFEPLTAVNYNVGDQWIQLFGSGGKDIPREFVVTFTLSDESRQAGYRFADAALKFFQGKGKSKDAGFRIPRNLDEVSATVTLFKTKAAGAVPAQDEFSLLLIPPDGQIFSHDPSIFWEPPLG